MGFHGSVGIEDSTNPSGDSPGPVYNPLVQVEPATAFFPVVAHWLVFPTPSLMLSTKHNGSRFHF